MCDRYPQINDFSQYLHPTYLSGYYLELCLLYHKLHEPSDKSERNFDFAGCPQHRLLLKICLISFNNFINSLVFFRATFIN